MADKNSYFYDEDVDWRSLGYISRAQYRSASDPNNRYSDNNPYARYIADENSRERRINLQQQAQDWEASNQSALLQRQWQLEDRAHDEEYNDPIHQAVLMQRAGLVAGTSGSSDGSGVGFSATSSGSAPAPAQVSTPESTVSPEASDTEKSQAVSGIVNDSASTIMQVLSFVNSSTKLPFELDILRHQSGIAANNEISSADNVTFARNADARQAQAHEASQLSFFRDSAVEDARSLLNTIDSEGNRIEPSEDTINELVDRVPAGYREYYKDKLNRYLSDSSVLSAAYDDIRNLRKAKAFNSVEGQTNFMSTYANLYYANDLSRLRTQTATNDFQKALQDVLASLNYADTLGSQMVSEAKAARSSADNTHSENESYASLAGPELSASSRVSRLQYAKDILTEQSRSFHRALTEVSNSIHDMDAKIANIENKSRLNSQDEITLSALRMARSQAFSFGASQLNSFYRSLFDFSRSYSHYQSTRSQEYTGVGYVFAPTGPAGISDTSTTFNSDYNWSTITFDKFLSDPAADTAASFTDIISKIIF